MIDWDSEVRGFYSRPEDLHTVYTAENRPSLPFTVQACNRNSLVAVGDESGAIRLIESAKDESPGFGMQSINLISSHLKAPLTPRRQSLRWSILPRQRSVRHLVYPR